MGLTPDGKLGEPQDPCVQQLKILALSLRLHGLANADGQLCNAYDIHVPANHAVIQFYGTAAVGRSF